MLIPLCFQGYQIVGTDPISTLRLGEVPNARIGIRVQEGKLVTYLLNWDAMFVNGPDYVVGKWIDLEVVFNFLDRTILGFCDKNYMGKIPFTKGISPKINFVQIAMMSSKKLPKSNAEFDDLLVIANAAPGESEELPVSDYQIDRSLNPINARSR